MPVLVSNYRPPPGLSNGHLQTILPALARRVAMPPPLRHRIETPDGDFLDLDLHGAGGRRVAIVSHGLEGDSRRAYVAGMARCLRSVGWDVVGWNFRGCSGVSNRSLRSYHSGASDDLGIVVDYVRETWPRRQIALVGFSLGGNVTLKYLGEKGDEAARFIAGAVAVSVPCDLAGCAARLETRENRFYLRRFLRTLVAKIELKHAMYPECLDVRGLREIRTFTEFDTRFTAPLHGFVDAADYWARCSSRQFLGSIRVPTLLLNARDDPFLSPSCFPDAEAAASAWLHLEAPAHGGHVGFIRPACEYWSESRARVFLEAACDRGGSAPALEDLGERPSVQA
jgi:predicted alpha/beta-fold hydrolase